MMQLYDSMILRVRELLEGQPVRVYAYDEKKAWPENHDFEMIFQKDVAFELGGGKAESANLTCVTGDAAVFAGGQGVAAGQGLPEGRIYVYGPDLQEIQGNVSYARICEVLVKDGGLAESKAKVNDKAPDMDASHTLTLLQDIDFVKFHVYGKGFMMRTSGQSAREPVRVSKKALQDGITFERMGDAFIAHYLQNPSVAAVRVSFVTAKAFDFGKLAEEAGKAVEIRNSLSKIQKGLPTECSVCDIREICNEVEGLRELHFGKKERAGKEPADSKKVIF